tara:strand:- start:158 stop:829 length:672 start_codon:yes stop_codon:yes gene_type:complete
MNTPEEKIESIGRRFLPTEILIRPGYPVDNDGTPHAQPLFYMDRSLVINRLNEAVGHHGWSDAYTEVGKGIVCKLSINLGDQQEERWYSKEDGAGESDIEGEKGAYSGALKRAANKWGMGMYLYTEFKSKEYLPAYHVGNSVRFTNESIDYCREVLWNDWHLAHAPGAKALSHMILSTNSESECDDAIKSNRDAFAQLKNHEAAYGAIKNMVKKHKESMKGNQ